ncbi:MAG: hypothetical protein ACRD22_04105 [Terriglobia bacterium]
MSNTRYFIPVNDLYLVGLLNSDAMWQFAKGRLTVLGYAEKRGLRFFTQLVQMLPAANASSAERALISVLAQNCLDARMTYWPPADGLLHHAEVDTLAKSLYPDRDR